MTTIDGFHPSPQQKDLWALTEGGGRYRVLSAVVVEGPLDLARLKESLHRLVARHEMLRTGFVVPPNQRNPLQVVAASGSVDWTVRQEVSKAENLVREEWSLKRALDGSPVLRALLAKLAADRYLLSLQIPALCGDLRAMEILQADLWKIYELGSPLDSEDDEPLQYTQYSQWLEELAADGGAGTAFWLERESKLGSYRARPDGAKPGEYRVQERNIRLASPARHAEAFFLTLWQTLLARHREREAPPVATAIGGRDHEELETMVGPVTRLVPHPVRPAEDRPFEEVLEENRQALDAAREWVHFHGLERGGARERLPHAFEYRDPLPPVSPEGLKLTPFASRYLGLPCDCQLTVTPRGEFFRLQLIHEAASLSEVEAADYLSRLEVLARSAQERPRAALGSLRMLTDEDRCRILVGLNEVSRPAEEPRDFCGRLAGHAAANPDKPALVFEPRTGLPRRLSYGAFLDRARALAGTLEESGAGPEDLVALMVPDPVALWTGVVAVLRTGAAFVVLDPNQPEARIREMVAGTPVRACISERPFAGLEWIQIPNAGSAPPAKNTGPKPLLAPEQLAYVVFTSGSTGKPKGVQVPRCGLNRYLAAVGDRFDFRDCDSFATVSTPAADLGYTQVFSAFRFGAALHLLDNEHLQDAQRFAEYQTRQGVDCLKITPSHLAALMSLSEPASVLPRKRLVLGGEAAPEGLPRAIAGLAPKLKLFNHYGPTETTVGVAACAYRESHRFLPLGKPLAQARLYAVNRYMELGPMGLPGELLIGGGSVARGYLGLPGLTAARFVPDPFSALPGSRLYRSGDLVRYSPEGELVFMGRVDHQVKIRGFRVEPDEVASVLKRCQGVTQIVVHPVKDPKGSLFLCAYAVGSDPVQELEASLRAAASERLPEYMRPAHYLFLDRLPLNANGKLDRAALPGPRFQRKDGSAPPQNETEQALLELWRRVLHRAGFGVDEDFFALGGHSLSGTIVLARVNERFGIKLPLAELFANPTIRGLAARIHAAQLANASPDELRRALKALDREDAHPDRAEAWDPDLAGKVTARLAVADAEAIPKLPRTKGYGGFSLSFSQRRLWFLQQLDPRATVYHLPSLHYVEGPLDCAALERALLAIAGRHEILRTRFVRGGKGPLQQVRPRVESAVSLVDGSALNEAEREILVKRLLKSEAAKPFDLAKGPLFRVGLFRLNELGHALALTLHHIVSDAWSNGIMVRELAHHYRRFVGDPSIGPKTGELPRLEIQYADYAEWQRRQFESGEWDRQLEYWLAHLEDAPPLLSLPTDRPRPAMQTFNGARHGLILEPQTLNALKKWCEASGATLFMGLDSLFAVLLGRYAGQDDVVVGFPIANRDRRETEHLIGFFVNTLMLRHRLEEDFSVRELLARVRATALAAFKNRDLPFEYLVEKLAPERNLSHAPLFQAMLVVQNAPGDGSTLPGVTTRSAFSETPTAKFDLTLFAFEGDAGLHLTCEYNRDLFDESTVRRMACHFRNLMAWAVSRPDGRLGEADLLDSRERGLLLREWSWGDSQPATAPVTPKWVERTADRVPDRIAVRAPETHLTYAAMERNARRLASRLMEKGLKPGNLVGVCIPRSASLISVLLAVWKAGGAYVPLESSNPPDRLAYMAADAKLQCAVTEDATEAALPETLARLTLHPPIGPGTASDTVPGSHAFPEPHPDMTAYVLYTSGSTGQPKGVAVSHAGLRHYLDWCVKAYGFSAGPDVPLFSSLGFDATVTSLWAPLAAGTTVVAVTRDRESEVLVKALATGPGYALLKLTPSHLASLNTMLFPVGPKSWQGPLVLGGEALHGELLTEWGEHAPDTRIVNEYGPTEAVVGCVVSDFPAKEVRPGPVPIGRPIDRTQILVLDRRLRPTPIGLTGELWIGGPGLARGYLSRPGLTAERFAPNPFAAEAGTRLYRTGDRVRYLDDGRLVYLGRIDRQVKLRGFRIEPGEIEGALTDLEKVNEAAVLLREDRGGPARLVAYLTTEPAIPADAWQAASAELRRDLSKRLPDFMLPSTFVFLTAMPLTANGKLDRDALPEPGSSGLDLDHTPPASPTEASLATLWSQTLQRESVGIHADFFELGGHSLLATQLMFRVEQCFGVTLGLRTLFEHPTVAGLAARIEQARAAQKGERSGRALAEIVPDPANRNEPFSLTDIQQAYLVGRSATFELGNLATQVFREVDVDTIDVPGFERAVDALVSRHDMLRAVVLDTAQQQILAEVPRFTLEILDLGHLDRRSAADQLRMLQNTLSHQVRPTDRWPLFAIRATRFRERIRLHFSMEALIADGWSIRMLMREFQGFYGEAPAPEPLRLSFRDYMIAMDRMEATPLFEKARQYWFRRLESLPPHPDLPLFRQPASLANPVFERRGFRLGPGDWSFFQERTAALGVTPAAALLTAFALVLAKWSPSRHFTLNLTLFNRLPLHPEINRIVGDFTSASLLEVDFREPAAFGERALQVQGQLWSDLDHRYVSAVRVMRERSRRLGAKAALMPVVCTVALGMSRGQETARPARAGEPIPAGDDLGVPPMAITQTPQVWLDHQISEVAGGLQILWDGIEALFPAGLLDDMFGAYTRVLTGLSQSVADWEAQVFDLVPKRQLLVRAAVNETASPMPAMPLHAPFFAQQKLAPDRIAVVSNRGHLTYERLARRVAGAARKLRAHGLSRDRLVAIFLEKRWEQVAAALAVSAAGGAYLPVEVTLPAERRRFLLKEGDVEQVVTRSGLAGKLDRAQYRLWFMDRMEDGPVDGLPAVSAGALAYVLFTSGSTGRPKGVAITHSAAQNTIQDINRRFDLTARDRVLALSALGFDLSVYDLFGLLAAGGGVVIPDHERRKDPSHWSQIMVLHGVSVWNTVPALMQMLTTYLADRPERVPPGLRLALWSGDWIPLTLSEQAKRLWPRIRTIGLGGATEASIWSNYFAIGDIEPFWKSIPYGKPLANQYYDVLDEDMNPCPDWVPGQLFIGGDGLALGYWRDPVKTETSFPRHPESGRRLYRTGDMGRYLPDGNLEFLGRRDFQVKVQGHRIELGEIEAALKGHPLVREAVVTARGSGTGRRLIAYLQARVEPEPAGDSPAGGQLASHAGNRLAFKLAEHGLRGFDEDSEAVALPPSRRGQRGIEAYIQRQSYRTFEKEPLPLQALADLLDNLSPLRFQGYPFPKYRYPSAGNLYPVQTYVFAKPNRIEGLGGGLYYYHPKDRTLRAVHAGPELKPADFGSANTAIFGEAAFAMFLVGKLDAIEPLYGKNAVAFCLLEAGYMSQLLMTEAAELGLGLCPVGSFDFDRTRAFFGLDERHLCVHSLLGGAVTEEQRLSLSTTLEDQPREKPVSPQEALRVFLEKRLPEYMIPAAYVKIDSFPLTANGKIDRDALPDVARERPENDPGALPKTALEKQIAGVWREVLGLESFGIHDSFFELGGNSVQIVQVHGKLGKALDRDLPIVAMFRHPTVHALSQYLELEQGKPSAEGRDLIRVLQPESRAEKTAKDPAQAADIAIIGFSGRFPGAPDVDTFWENLRQGVESITRLEDRDLLAAGVPEELLSHPNYVKAAAVLEGIELFDADFFGYPPREAETTDPQHRLFLEESWRALEHAGYDPGQFEGSIGVYTGLSLNKYMLKHLFPNAEAMNLVGALQGVVGNDKDYLPTRVSYKLNLRGPSVNIQTACSTSLVAVHTACQSLLNDECEIALAGGVSINLPQNVGYLYQDDMILSPDGHCRAFDADARGTVFGSGVAVVVLKRLSDALMDGDVVHAVLKGTAVNNDGSRRVGFTAPGVEGQRAVIEKALTRAKVDSGTIGYVETHGTGTQLGDPIEFEALCAAYRHGSWRPGSIPIGSVKTNVGHLETAAGVTGLIKAVMALKHGLIPPSLHFRKPNPKIDFENGPFFVNTSCLPWREAKDAGDRPCARRAAVSSFGIGGTNAHAIVEEAPLAASSYRGRPLQLLVLSAKTAKALEARCAALGRFLERHPQTKLADVAFTLGLGRKAFEHRRFTVCGSGAEAAAVLSDDSERALLPGSRNPNCRSVAFLFPGQGAQYIGMAEDLSAGEPLFRYHLEYCFDLLKPKLGFDLRTVMYPSAKEGDAGAGALNRTVAAQPAIFAVSYALAMVLRRWGMVPDSMIGHSIGELVAACLAGVFSLEDALDVVALRARLMQSLPPGAMASVALDEASLKSRLDDGLAIASVNGPELCVVSGPTRAVARFTKRLSARNVDCRRLHTSHAFHSDMMEPILGAFEARLAKIAFSPPKIPFISNLTGDWITDEMAMSPTYWAAHLRGTVRFDRGLETLAAPPERALLEVGPGTALATLARQRHRDRTVVSCLPHPREKASALQSLLTACGRLWLAGIQPDWTGFYHDQERARVALPTYPFDRKRYWIDAPRPRVSGSGPEPVSSARTEEAEAVPSNQPGEPATTASSLGLHARPDLPVAYVPPEGETETRLAQLWERLLGIGKIGAMDSFFELGGHSLLATRLNAEVSRAMGIGFPLGEFFEQPTIRGLAKWIEAAPRDHREETAFPFIDLRPNPENRHRPFPLTDIQHAYWVGRNVSLELSNVATHVYNEIRADGLSLGRIELAWQRLIDHHDMLRMVVLADGTQRILERAGYRIQAIDLRGLEPEARNARIERLRGYLSHQVHAGDRWPLFDIRALLADDGSMRLTVSFDMLIGDAWSMNLLARQFPELYLDPERPLADLEISFRDYVLAEHALRDTEIFIRSRDYWLKRLDTLPPAPELPLAMNPMALQKPRFQRRRFHLAADRWTVLKQRAAQAGITPSGLLLAAFGNVLAQWSKSRQLTVNMTLFNRLPLHPRINDLVGDFTTTILLAMDCGGQRDFTEHARAVQQQLWRDLDHRYFNGVQVLRELFRKRRGRAAMPVVFTSTLGQEPPNAAREPREAAGEPRPLKDATRADASDQHYSVSQTPQVWLDHLVSERGGALSTTWDAVEELFPAGLLDDMFQTYCRLLDRLASEDEPWHQAAGQPLPDPQRARRAALNQTESPLPAGLLHDGFLARALSGPDAAALIAPGAAVPATVTYGALHGRALHMSARLKEQGARPNTLVAVVMEKSPAQIEAVLAVSLCGAAYLPIDPEQPWARRRQLFEDGEVALAVTQPHLDSGLEWPDTLTRLVHRPTPRGTEPQPEPPRAEASDIAYVIYTSGSTGKPKGVVMAHCATLNTVADINRRCNLGRQDRVLALSALSFDLSVYDIFGLLAAGGALVLPQPEEAKEPEAWAHAIRNGGVTLWNSVPALLGMLATYLGKNREDADNRLRLALLSGDWIPLSLPDRVRDLWPSIRLISLGGATEAAIWSIWYPIDEVNPDWKSVPYGKPLTNQHFHVLNEFLEDVPDWVPGMLYIGGAGLAEGYWRDEALTNDRFVVHPASGERLYRTGDLGRYLPDGNIEFLGREDFQVKVGGFRIELGEIEAALMQEPSVKSCVVHVWGNPMGHRTLVAYVVGRQQQTAPDPDRLRSFLRRKLPAYMVPELYQAIDALPLSANGKVDRNALPDPNTAHLAQPSFTPPRDETEARLASIWAEILSLERIGIEANFFELGGDSLLGTQVVTWIQDAFKVTLPLRTLFERPTVAGLAQAIKSAAQSETGTIKRVPRRARLMKLSGADAPRG